MTAPILETGTLLGQQPRTTRELVELWHNETHAGVLKFCTEQPCHAIARAAQAFANGRKFS